MRLNYKVILHILGILITINGGFMFITLLFSGKEDFYGILLSAVITTSVGSLLFYLTRKFSNRDVKKKEGYLIVTTGWLFMSLFGTLPYLLTETIPDYTNAFFETLSGYSTTGATILQDIESLPNGVLFWRSLTQWVGGMGIIVLTVAVLPILGIGGMQLFVAEAPGISPDKLQPRIKETAKRLWYIYLGLTLVETALLWVGGLSFFDAINHALTTMATGGFSTKNASIAHFQSPFIQYVITLFMFLAGTNFTMTYFGLHGKFGKVIRNEEFRFYLLTCIIIAVGIALTIYFMGSDSFEKSFRDSLFQVVSFITTTGYTTTDYTGYDAFITLLFLILLFFGASAGSTAGGVKIVRHIILIKNSILELKRQIHRSAIIPVRFNQRAVSQDIVFNILAFIMIYIVIFAGGSIFVSMFNVDFVTSMGSVATCLGNVGPGFGLSEGGVVAVTDFADFPAESKWILSFLMLLGRLELFTVLILFTPYFWRKY
ncbi:MAG: TrkH family potassium uptake protein [Cyclobacteriaceae bacterium]